MQGFCSCSKSDVARQVSEQLAKIEELQKKYKDLYGGATAAPIKLWELESDRLSYPRGDKYKLHEISKQWIKYYKCCVDNLRQLTSGGAVAGVSITGYEGATVRIPCSICTSRLHPPVIWLYAESLDNLTYIPMEEKESAVVGAGLLTIYRVQHEDAGVYTCQLGATYGNTVVLEVVDINMSTNPSVVVKPRYSTGPYINPPVQYGEFSICGNPGACAPDAGDGDVSEDMACVMWHSTSGVGCRSKILPQCLRHEKFVMSRPNLIMLKMCRPACQTNVVFNVLTSTGVVLERANNSAGIYSLALPLPRQPPPVARELMFAEIGQKTTVKCKGTSLRDIPVTWRVGESHVSERGLDKKSGGRVRVNAHDHIVFDPVWAQDQGLYR
ncbi:hypothetical protein NE865_10776 [Phthorimaea operculella]|nr:hypothetical protein NE865_10776 [Phthorimaea operculella]